MTGGPVVEAQAEADLPPGMNLYRCIYCNCQFLSDHGDDDGCDCSISFCPNENCQSNRNPSA